MQIPLCVGRIQRSDLESGSFYNFVLEYWLSQRPHVQRCVGCRRSESHWAPTWPIACYTWDVVIKPDPPGRVCVHMDSERPGLRLACWHSMFVFPFIFICFQNKILYNNCVIFARTLNIKYFYPNFVKIYSLEISF